jgi:hypothetical protein
MIKICFKVIFLFNIKVKKKIITKINNNGGFDNSLLFCKTKLKSWKVKMVDVKGWVGFGVIAKERMKNKTDFKWNNDQSIYKTYLWSNNG